MKVARDVKGDVGKSGGNSSSGDSGALFPRLHVKETKADGPRAPPRNKMALYEQFSIPSQRFAAASGNGAGNKKALYEQFSIPSHRFFQPGRQNPEMMNQPASCDGRFMYTPYYVSPHAYAGVSYPGQFLGQNLMSCSNSTATESDKLAKGTEQSSRVASYSIARAPKAHCNENPFSLNVNNAEDLTTQASTKLNNSDVLDHGAEGGLHLEQELQITSSPPHVDSCMKYPDQSYGPVIENDGTETKERETEFCNGNSRAPCDDTYSADERQCLQKHSIEGDESRLENEDNYQSKNSSTSDNIADSKGFNLLSNSRECQVFVGQNSESKEPSKSISGCVESQYSGENISGDVDKDMDRCRKHEKSQKPESVGDKYESHPCNDRHSSVAVSGHHENDEGDSSDHNSDSSMVDSLHAFEVSPKNVIAAIGQREFWRVRKAILRQQKIFSTQVFELHRLVKVQKLIATTSNLLSEDNVYENLPVSTPEEHCVPTISPRKCLKSLSIHVDHDCEITTDKVKPSNKEMAINSTILSHPSATGNVEPVAQDARDRSHAGAFPIGAFVGSTSAWGYPAYIQDPCAVASHPGCYGCYHQYPMNQFGVPNAVFGIPYSMEGNTSGSQNIHGCQHQCKCSAGHQAKVLGHFPKYPSPDVCYNSTTPVPFEPLISAGNTCYPVPDAGRTVANVSGKEVSKGSFGSESVQKQPQQVANLSIDKGSNGYCSQDSISQVSVRQNDQPLAQTKHHVVNSKSMDTVRHSSVSLSEQKHNDKDMRKNRFNSLNWTLSEEAHEYQSANPSNLNEDVAGVPDTVDLENQVLSLFPLSSSFSCTSETKGRSLLSSKEQQVRVIKAVPRAAMAASESTADILLSLQRERHQ